MEGGEKSLEQNLVPSQNAKQTPSLLEKIEQLKDLIKAHHTDDKIRTQYAKWLTKDTPHNPKVFAAATKEASDLLKKLCDEGYISKQETVGSGMSGHIVVSYSIQPYNIVKLDAYLEKLKRAQNSLN